jgi:hypothetical protein
VSYSAVVGFEAINWQGLILRGAWSLVTCG